MQVSVPVRRVGAIIRETLSQWIDERAPRMAASLAFYTTFSLAPILIIAVALAGLVFGRDAAQGKIVGEMQGLVGVAGARAIQDLVENASRPASGTLATLIGVITLLFGATGVVGELQDSLNTIWNVRARPKSSWWTLVRTRIVSFAMVLGIGFVLLVSLVLSTLLNTLTEFAGRLVTSIEPIAHLLDFGFSFFGVTLLFGMLYKWIPDARVAWRDVWAGAAVAAVLFAVGKFALGYYLGRSSLTSAYGAAGSLVVLLLWVYYSAQILLFGAEWTQVCATSRRGAEKRKVLRHRPRVVGRA
jgi:membrane protein